MLDIPVRYASSYVLGFASPNFHGFVQVDSSGAWHNIDATIEGVRPALIPIAVEVRETLTLENGLVRV